MDIPTPDEFIEDSAERIVEMLKKEMRNSDNQYGCRRYVVTIDDRTLCDWDVAREVSRGFESSGWNMYFRQIWNSVDYESYAVLQYFIWPQDDHMVPVEESDNCFRWIDSDEINSDHDVMKW